MHFYCIYILYEFFLKVIQNLEYLIQVCQNETDNKTVCIDGLAANIKRGVSLEMTEIDLKEGRDLLQKLVSKLFFHCKLFFTYFNTALEFHFVKFFLFLF